jgi:hypothetical protein
MTSLASGRISAAKTGWIIVLLMTGWALFLFVPFGREEKNESPKMAVARPGEAELAAVGLGFNVDWIGLPRYFEVWAKEIPWIDDKAEFAMWNPGARAYSYVFEATRTGDRYRFRLLSPSEAEMTLHLAADLTVPDEQAETHPFIFPYEHVENSEVRYPPGSHLSPPMEGSPEMKVKVDMAPAKIVPPNKLDREESVNNASHK